MWRGCFTALVTPFRDGKVDERALEGLIEKQVEGGVRGVVVAGTTGEAPTLLQEEYERLLRSCVRRAAGRVSVLAGTGTYSTAESIERTRVAIDAGVQAVMVVTPYYNRPGPEGLRRHFLAIADSSSVPMLLYNIPSRTGSEIPVGLALELGQHPRIEAIKDATQSAAKASELIAGGGLAVLSGDDALTLPWMALGASGVVSVASNIVPAEVSGLVDACLQGDFEKARLVHFRLLPLFQALFLESNPAPAKALLALLGSCTAEVRSPLTEVKATTRQILQEVWTRMQAAMAGKAVGAG